MKRWKHNFKKGMAFVLSLVMVAGLVPAMSGGANTVQAATGSGTEPSVSAFATKKQLMDETFAPNSSGEATNIGKLVFGNNSSGKQEWYILGKDTGVSGDNTIIFAASPIATGQKFNESGGNKNDSNLWSDCNYGEASVSKVYANHYGASDLRDTLQSMATNTNYFTTAEQGLMNPTTVTTNDTKNSKTYTTTDKLYALAADGYGESYKTIKAGSDNNTVLAMSSYWSSEDEWFWLRSPRIDDGGYALLALPGGYVYDAYVFVVNAVQPASNLDLSSVLFASAATAASSDTKSEKITDGTAMTLRLDGTGKNIGTVTYNTTTGDIKAVKGSTSQTVALVVQGNDGTNNWYYSKQITGTEVVNVTDIEAESNTPESIDLSTCKIWLEATDSTENLTYAVDASAAGIVGAPTANPTAGTYTENQSITLTSSTEGATIYYTTDGSEPKITGGVPDGTTAQYTAPIAVTGTEGQSITTTIKAIAVKDIMQDSSVETFTYTIQIPVPKYEVTVTNGSGSGNYAQGSTVTITANTAPNGQRFKEWTIESGNITLASSTSDTTTFLMPAGAVSVKANYEAIPTPVSYKILDGANSDWKQNTEETITIRGNGDFSKFVGVKIDGNTIDAKNYTAKEGSTIITLTTDYLKTLSIGTHTFEIVWTDGSAGTNFTVSKNDSSSETPKDDDENKNDDSGSQTGDNQHITAPQTGDNSHPTLWISLLGASLIGLLATLYMRKKKDNE